MFKLEERLNLPNGEYRLPHIFIDLKLENESSINQCSIKVVLAGNLTSWSKLVVVLGLSLMRFC